MKTITFDRFVRGAIFIAVLLLAGWAFASLSDVLIPFVAAGTVAYMLNPVVNFLQNTCRLRLRFVCVVLTLLLSIGLVVGLLWLCVPPMVEECAHLGTIVRHYLENRSGSEHAGVPTGVYDFFEEHLRRSDLTRYLQTGDIATAIRDLLPHVWDMITSAASAVTGMVAWLFALLYLFFLLLDYDRCAQSWISYVPQRHRRLARQLAGDVTHYVCGYFRGQCGVALSNCVLFSTGFLLVGFPLPLSLGCFIGIVSFVPYLQVVGLLPAAILALLRAAETGQNFWLLLGSVLLVYIVVQIIQDVVITPRIMGRIMGLSPAIVLLALSVGGSLLGIIGLIVALPVTTLGLKYYKRYVVGDSADAETDSGKAFGQ